VGGGSREQASSVDEIASAISTVVTWSARNDIQQETMRRARCNLPPGAIWLLSRIAECGPVRLTDLAASVGLDASTINPQTKRLERARLIHRKPDPRDGRASLLYATRAGQSLLERTYTARGSMLTGVLGGWSERDLASAARTLTRLAECLVSPMR
jgi:DNA-binding MarR family transcriptional regulator